MAWVMSDIFKTTTINKKEGASELPKMDIMIIISDVALRFVHSWVSSYSIGCLEHTECLLFGFERCPLLNVLIKSIGNM